MKNYHYDLTAAERAVQEARRTLNRLENHLTQRIGQLALTKGPDNPVDTARFEELHAVLKVIQAE